MPCVQRFQDFIPQLCLSKVLQNELGKNPLAFKHSVPFQE